MFCFDPIWRIESSCRVLNMLDEDSVLTVSYGLNQKPSPNNPKRLPHHITLVEDVLDINHSIAFYGDIFFIRCLETNQFQETALYPSAINPVLEGFP